MRRSALGLTVLVVVLAAYPALAHHKPGHHHGPSPTTLPATTTTRTSLPSTTTVTTGPYDPTTATYGPRADYTQPAGSTTVNTTDDLGAVVAAGGTGVKYWLTAGTHRVAAEVASHVIGKSGIELHFAPGAVANGSKVLTGWTSDGAGRWFVDGQTQRGIDGPELTPGGNPVSPADAPWSWKSETVWIDNVIQKAQNSLATTNVAGEWFFDYGHASGGRIYIATDPAGKTVETSIADTFLDAADGAAPNVKVFNATIEKYMPRLNVCAVDGGAQSGWQIIDSLVRWNHGGGVRADSGAVVLRNKVFENGQIGVKGAGTGGRWEANEIAYNNTMGIASGFEGGGSKFVFSTDLVLRRNWSHHNVGPGLWTDIQNRRSLYVGNLCEHNARMGIFHEISYDATIRGNTVRYNGTDIPGQGANYNPEGAGITVNGSAGVEVSHNIVLDNAGGGIAGIRDSRSGGVEGYELRALSVHDNHITIHTGLPGVGGGTPVNGVLDQTGTTAFSAAANNRFEANTYVAGSLSTTFWQWDNTGKTWAQWQAVPQDANGSASVG